MKIYLIRHAEREQNSTLPERFRPLSFNGENQTKALAERLKTEGIPTLFLTSMYRPAQQTAEILRNILHPAAPLIPLEVLTPHLMAEHFGLGKIISDSTQAGQDLSGHQVVAIVLHHPRQTQLGMMLKGKDHRIWRSEPEPGYSGSICLVATALHAFMKGEGVETIRI